MYDGLSTTDQRTDHNLHSAVVYLIEDFPDFDPHFVKVQYWRRLPL